MGDSGPLDGTSRHGSGRAVKAKAGKTGSRGASLAIAGTGGPTNTRRQRWTAPVLAPPPHVVEQGIKGLTAFQALVGKARTRGAIACCANKRTVETVWGKLRDPTESAAVALPRPFPPPLSVNKEGSDSAAVPKSGAVLVSRSEARKRPRPSGAPLEVVSDNTSPGPPERSGRSLTRRGRSRSPRGSGSWFLRGRAEESIKRARDALSLLSRAPSPVVVGRGPPVVKSGSDRRWPAAESFSDLSSRGEVGSPVVDVVLQNWLSGGR